jgi:lathosterol oxidase
MFESLVERGWPDPTGLLLGLASVVAGQTVVVLYHFGRRYHGEPFVPLIQYKAPVYDFVDEVRGHVSRFESFFQVFCYLAGTWMLRLLPASYYDMGPDCNWLHVFLQLLVVDWWTYVCHVLEHRVVWIYQNSHKPHHRWTNPKLFDAYSGSAADTLLLILVPLFLTHWCCPFVTCYSFVAFGTLYSADFFLIHSEYSHPWDGLFRTLGFGTAADHNVHHSQFRYNFGHFFTYYDRLFGTYREPASFPQVYQKYA